MTALLSVEFEDDGVTRKLTRDEIPRYTQVVAGAVIETTGRLIGWLAKVLAEHPDPRREIEQDRSLLSRTVDETLRSEPTGPQNLARLEGRVALDELLNRWPDWKVDYETAQLAPTSTVRGWERLRLVLP
jgi:cytochrome P450